MPRYGQKVAAGKKIIVKSKNKIKSTQTYKCNMPLCKPSRTHALYVSYRKRQRSEYVSGWKMHHPIKSLSSTPPLFLSCSTMHRKVYCLPRLAKEVIFSVASICVSVCVCLFALCRLNHWTYGPKIWRTH